MNVESIMTHKVVTVELDDSLSTIREIFDNVKFHHLLVVGSQGLLGIISDRDLLKALSPFLGMLDEHRRDLAVLNKKAHQIMSREPVAVDKETSIEAAANLLLSENVSCLPITSSDGKIEGIVTWKDIFKAYLHGSDGQRRKNKAQETTLPQSRPP
jgi:acetoin utilization protein AcuB